MCSRMVIDFFITSDTCRVTLLVIQMIRYELRTPQLNWRCFPKGLEYPNPVVAQICLLIYNINTGWVDWLLPLHYNTGWIWRLWGRGEEFVLKLHITPNKLLNGSILCIVNWRDEVANLLILSWISISPGKLPFVICRLQSKGILLVLTMHLVHPKVLDMMGSVCHMEHNGISYNGSQNIHLKLWRLQINALYGDTLLIRIPQSMQMLHYNTLCKFLLALYIEQQSKRQITWPVR
jgi:hypothetical protein